jgi:predicted acetyltransferase
MNPFLTEPTLRYRDSFLAAIREFQSEGRHSDLNTAEMRQHFPRYLQSWQDRKHHPAPGMVAETTFWLMDGATFIGRLSLRHELNANLVQFGGHIGYEIRPTKRRQGYGTRILQLGLEQARARRLERVLITCDDTNIASARIIEANGGLLENIILVEGRSIATRRYWIEVGGG